MSDPEMPFLLHASCVAIEGRALVLLGVSGSGKSGLALQMIALGAHLVADDQTILQARDGELIASAPAQIAGGIEARGVGLLSAPTTPEATVTAFVDMERTETARLPDARVCTYLGVSKPLFHSCSAPHSAAAYSLFLRYGMFAA